MNPEKDQRPDIDDETLLRSLRDSNSHKDALLIIFDRYSRQLYSYAHTEITKRVRGAKADDIAQKILIMVIASLQVNHELIPTGTTLSDFLFGSADRAISLYIQEIIENN